VEAPPTPTTPPPAGITVNEILAGYLRHAAGLYIKGGKPTSEFGCIKLALKHVAILYGRRPAAALDCLALETVRDAMIADGLARSTVNGNVGRIKRCWKWAARKKHVSAAAYADLCLVEGLRAGQFNVRETTPVRPVAWDLVEAIKPHVAAPVWAIAQLQWWTGMRSGEVCIMRGRDIDMAGGDVWLYTPASHKTEHHGLSHVVDLGPRAQDVLRPFLKGDPEAFLFQPTEAVEKARQRQREDRKPGGPGNHKRPADSPRRAAGQRYTTDSYRRAIARGCVLAFPPEGELARREGETRKQWKAGLTPEGLKELAAWRKAHHWHPHQLRHSAATRIRKEAGIDAARAVLGHHSIPMAEHYAEQDRELVRGIAKRIG
jgi:integrase